MTVYIPTQKNKRYKNPREYLFIFSDCEALTTGILFLYRLKINFKSMLYKTENDYRLIISSRTFKPCFLTLNEFCIHYSASIIETEYTKEYGKLLIAKNAVKIFGKCFSKDF